MSQPPPGPAPDASAVPPATTWIGSGGPGAPPAGGSWGPSPGPWGRPPEPRKRRWGWLAALLALLLLVAIGVGVAVAVFLGRLQGPIDATNEVLSAVRRGDYSTAYRRSCSVTRSQFSPDQFAASLTATADARGAMLKYDVDYAALHGSRATVRYDITWARSGTQRFESAVLHEDGRWRPCLLER